MATGDCEERDKEKVVIAEEDVGSNDVCFGRGAKIINNEGNVRFRALVQTRKSEYTIAICHQIKGEVASEIYAEIVGKRKGRFLKRRSSPSAETKASGSRKAKSWVEADEDLAIEKIKQTLRGKTFQSEKRKDKAHRLEGLNCNNVHSSLGLTNEVFSTPDHHQLAMRATNANSDSVKHLMAINQNQHRTEIQNYMFLNASAEASRKRMKSLNELSSLQRMTPLPPGSFFSAAEQLTKLEAIKRNTGSLSILPENEAGALLANGRVQNSSPINWQLASGQRVESLNALREQQLHSAYDESRIYNRSASHRSATDNYDYVRSEIQQRRAPFSYETVRSDVFTFSSSTAQHARPNRNLYSDSIDDCSTKRAKKPRYQG